MSNKKLCRNMYQTIKDSIDAFDDCINGYLYVYDIRKDQYYISQKALMRFAIKKSEFDNVLEEHSKFVYPEDVPALVLDLQQLINGEKREHNLVYRWLGKEGKPIWINCRGKALLDDEGNSCFLVGCINEVGTKPIADNLSGLLESIAIKEILDEIHEQSPYGFIMRLGIDDFKYINEKIGIEYGDFVLKGVSECIVNSLSKNQRAYRVVADEFMIVDTGVGTIEDAQNLYTDIHKRVDSFIEENDYKAVYTISAGIVLADSIEQMEYNEIMKISQFALTCAKNHGKNQTYCFEMTDYESFLWRQGLLEQLQKSVADDYRGFELFFQPIVQVGVKGPYAAESLLRFTTTEGERVSPVEFIPILEESGLIIPVGRWVINQAMSMCKQCQKIYPDFKISVNLSYVQILKSNVYEDIEQGLLVHNLKPESFIVELTESGYVDDNSLVMNQLWKRLREYGVWIALDDFGTGYSNFQLISSMIPNIIKLDRSFTVKTMQNAFEHQLMDHIIQLVHSVNLKICVEGVETQAELDEVEKLSADCIQGYFYGRPCAEKEFMISYIDSQ